MKKFILLTSFLFLSVLTFAQTVTWNGGVGDWNVAANWSTNAVPDANNDVEILSGLVSINAGVAKANSIFIDNAGSLQINQNGTLLISGSTASEAIYAIGTIQVSGELKIEFSTDNAIILDGTISILPTGRVELYNAVNLGLYVRSSGTVLNYGQLIISDCGRECLSIRNQFINYGTGYVDLSVSPWDGIVLTVNGTFENEGSVNIRSVNMGIYGSGSDIINYASGSIEISDLGNDGIWMSSGDIVNNGNIHIEAHPNNTGINMQTRMVNQSDGYIFIDNASFGMTVNTVAIVRNKGVLHFGPNNINAGLSNVGAFYNEVCGDLIMDSKLQNVYGAFMQNNGWMKNHDVTVTTLFGTTINNGIMEDNPTTLIASVTNNGVQVVPLTGTVQVGVPINNALDLVNWNSYTVLGWYVGPTMATSAGIYDPVNNTFTPDAAAVGETELYIHFLEQVTGCQMMMRIEITGGVLPYVAPPSSGTLSQQNVHQTVTEPSEFNIFPNPSAGGFNVKNNSATGMHQLQLFDALGRETMMLDVDFDKGPAHQINTNGLPSGNYFLVLSKNGQAVQTEKLQLTN